MKKNKEEIERAVECTLGTFPGKKKAYNRILATFVGYAAIHYGIDTEDVPDFMKEINRQLGIINEKQS